MREINFHAKAQRRKEAKRNSLNFVNFDRAQAADESFVSFLAARARFPHFLTVLEIGAPALQDDVGGARYRRLVEFESGVGEHARVEIGAIELAQIVTRHARRLMDDAGAGRRVFRDILDT